jgi:hypothetical protein
MPSKTDIIQKTNVYSWGAKVDFVLGRGYELEELTGNVVLVWDCEEVLELSRRKIHPDLEAAGLTGYRLVLNATDTACAAERRGLALVFGLLWMGVTQHYAIGLEWPESPLPCRVIDRTASGGIRFEAFASVSRRLLLAEFVRRLEEGFRSAPTEMLDRMLLSMELYCGSQLESSKRAQFVMLVSALEAVCSQAKMGSEVDALIEDVLVPAVNSAIAAGDVQASLIGRIRLLTRESVRGAIRRLMREHGFSQEDLGLVDDAYGLRSEILHEGRRIPELDVTISRLRPILSELYSKMSGVKLVV